MTLVDAGYTADGVIIVDGTWPERIVVGHLGQIWIDAEIEGTPVAACVESRGVNPIYLAMEFISELRACINKLNDQVGPYCEKIDRPFFVNIGAMHSGVWHGSVPAQAQLNIQMGFPYTFTSDELFDLTYELAKSVSDRIRLTRNLLDTPAYKGSAEAPLVSKLGEIVQRNAANSVQLVTVTGHSDMRHFQTPNVCLYGPGGGKNPHGIDEHYNLDHMPRVALNILEFAREWCNELR